MKKYVFWSLANCKADWFCFFFWTERFIYYQRYSLPALFWLTKIIYVIKNWCFGKESWIKHIETDILKSLWKSHVCRGAGKDKNSGMRNLGNKHFIGILKIQKPIADYCLLLSIWMNEFELSNQLNISILKSAYRGFFRLDLGDFKYYLHHKMFASTYQLLLVYKLVHRYIATMDIIQKYIC